MLIKIGGGKNINLEYVCQDIKTLVDEGEELVVVHGASVVRDEVAEKLGLPTKTITSPTGISSVYTNSDAINIFLMTYSGLVNKKIVATLQRCGVNAVGLSGIDGRLWTGKRKTAVYSKVGTKTKLITDNMTGRVTQINVHLIHLLLDNKYVPVICPPALSEENEIINTDNDWATAVMASKLRIEKMVVLFEAPGFLKKVNDEASLIKKIDKHKLNEYIIYAQGRMKKKLLGAQEAFRLGLQKMYWSDGRVRNPIINALKGAGTIIC